MSIDPNLLWPIKNTDLWVAIDYCVTEILCDAAITLNHYRLNETASFIWERCDGRHSAFDIALALYNNFEDSSPGLEAIVDDVIEVLHDLRKKNVIFWKTTHPKDVLLVAPPFPSTYIAEAIDDAMYSSPPLGLAYIASVLRDADVSVAIKDLHLEVGNCEDVIASCREFLPRIVGITSTTPTYPNALAIARFVKAWRPDTVVLMGGVHVSALPSECLASGVVDYVVIGEGELTMLDLAKFLLSGEGEIRAITGIAYLDEEKELVTTPPRLPIVDLDTLPFPARDLIPLERYLKKGSICTSRGCPMGCSFCACNLVFGKQYRVLSVARVLDEIEYLEKTYGITDIDFNDDTFNWNINRVFDLCAGIRERGIKIRWSCFCRAAQMTVPMAEAMAAAGCQVVQFGVESGSPQVLKTLNKMMGLEEVEAAVNACRAAGIYEVVCGIMLGHPEDTLETIEETYQFCEHLLDIGVTRVMLSLLTPYPGTEAYLNAESLGIRFVTKDWEKYIFSRVVIETSNLNKVQLRTRYVEGLLRFLAHEEQRAGKPSTMEFCHEN